MTTVIQNGDFYEAGQVLQEQPQASMESAVQAAVAYYAQQPGDHRPLEMRRDAAIGKIMGILKQAGPMMQESYKRALMVPALLESGEIERLAPDGEGSDGVADAARALYIQSVNADSRLAVRLLRKLSADVQALEGEGASEYLNRLAGVDFDRGFDACEYPTLHADAEREAMAVASVDEDGVVDDDRISRENLHLIGQALKIRLHSEAVALGLAPRPAEVGQHQVSGDAGGNDVIDVAALMLTSRELGTEGGSEYPRQR